MDALARVGEERSAAAGDVLFRVGDPRYPLIAIIEGEAAILDAAGHEIVRHGRYGFLGEMNLLFGADRVPDSGGHETDALRGRRA
jgi:hypothetical protein